MKKFRFIIEDLAGDVFYDQHQPVRGSILFLYGFPSFVGQNQVIQESVSSGYVLISPHYYGTYDSNGYCSPQTMIQTAADTDTAVRAGEIRKFGSTSSPIPIPPITVAIGHSFGTAVLVRMAHRLPALKRVLLLAPTMHYGRSPVDYGMRSDGREGYTSTAASHRNTYRLADDSEWLPIFDGADTPEEHDLRDQLDCVDLVIGELDPYFEVAVAADASEKLVRSYLGGVRCSTTVLPGVAHGIDELLGKSGFNLGAWLDKPGGA